MSWQAEVNDTTKAAISNEYIEVNIFNRVRIIDWYVYTVQDLTGANGFHPRVNKIIRHWLHPISRLYAFQKIDGRVLFAVMFRMHRSEAFRHACFSHRPCQFAEGRRFIGIESSFIKILFFNRNSRFDANLIAVNKKFAFPLCKQYEAIRSAHNILQHLVLGSKMYKFACENNNKYTRSRHAKLRVYGSIYCRWLITFFN